MSLHIPTGVQIKLILAMVFTILSATALFSGVWPQVALTHPRTIEFTPYVPIVNMTMAKYRTPMLSVAAPRTKPKIATHFEMVICLQGGGTISRCSASA